MKMLKLVFSDCSGAKACKIVDLKKSSKWFIEHVLEELPRHRRERLERCDDHRHQAGGWGWRDGRPLYALQLIIGRVVPLMPNSGHLMVSRSAASRAPHSDGHDMSRLIIIILFKWGRRRVIRSIIACCGSLHFVRKLSFRRFYVPSAI